MMTSLQAKYFNAESNITLCQESSEMKKLRDVYSLDHLSPTQWHLIVDWVYRDTSAYLFNRLLLSLVNTKKKLQENLLIDEQFT